MDNITKEEIIELLSYYQEWNGGCGLWVPEYLARLFRSKGVYTGYFSTSTRSDVPDRYNAVNIATACQTWVVLPQRHFNPGETVVCGDKCCQFIVKEAIQTAYWKCPFCEKHVRLIIQRLSDHRGVEAGCFNCWAV